MARSNHCRRWTEKDRGKKRAFKEKYGRRPNKQEIKLLKNDQIDLSGIAVRSLLSPMNIGDQLMAKRTPFEKGGAEKV